MLRSLLISLSKNSWLKRTITNWGVARRASQRFVAGETLTQAIDAVRKLNQSGIVATLDQLGENTNSVENAKQATLDVISILDAIIQTNIRANVSVKLSQIGLTIDQDLCLQNLKEIVDHAEKNNLFVRIDMEGSDLTSATLQMYRVMIDAGNRSIGIVIQSYLYRSQEDIETLSKWGGKVRLCKGAYKEPASVAFPNKSAVDENFDHLVTLLFHSAQNESFPRLSAEGRMPPIPALATHDIKRISFAKKMASSLGIPKDALEFQMLYGIRRDLQSELVDEGYPVRVYVPFGTQWYPYFMRRLAERPANLWFFISNFFHK
jgi:proline dehydrogenase